MGVIISAVALFSTYWLGRRSLVHGIICAIGFGYIFGITRANLPDTTSFFIFDSAVLGLYAAQSRQITAQFFTQEGQRLKHWVVFLMLLPIILFLVPLQDPLVQLVGLRGNMFLLPFILIAARLDSDQMYEIGLCLAMFNIAAFTAGLAEFVFGIEHFFPRNAVTELIYRSNDVGGGNAYRIPSLFANAHSFGGMMVVSLPWVTGAWLQQHRKIWHKNILLAGMIAAMVGVFMSAARVHFLAMIIVVGVFTFSSKLRPIYRVGWVVVLLIVGYIVASNPRMQRFKTLNDTEYVSGRFHSSVNVSLVEAVIQYPFGVGLGGGGTSIPYFLEDKVKRPVSVESEIGRIHLETGIIGMAAWLGFMLWVFTRPRPPKEDPWFLATRMAWACCLSFFAMGLIGIGLFTAIPSSAVMLMSLGWIATRHSRQAIPFAPLPDPRLARTPIAVPPPDGAVRR
jgi:hypothetical protein